jgi:hypothetical protein
LYFAAIEGISVDSVTSASEKIQAIIDGVSFLSMQSFHLKKFMAITTFFFRKKKSLKCIMLVLVT